MINLIEGKFNLGGINILAASADDLSTLSEKGLIEKREDAVGIYYHAESEASGMRFGVNISLRDRGIDWLRLSWLDSPVKGWEDASEKAMKDEYRLLSDFVEKMVERPADSIKNRKRTWLCRWGRIEVTYEPRAYQADIYIKPVGSKTDTE